MSQAISRVSSLRITITVTVTLIRWSFARQQVMSLSMQMLMWLQEGLFDSKEACVAGIGAIEGGPHPDHMLWFEYNFLYVRCAAFAIILDQLHDSPRANLKVNLGLYAEDCDPRLYLVPVLKSCRSDCLRSACNLSCPIFIIKIQVNGQVWSSTHGHAFYSHWKDSHVIDTLKIPSGQW